MPAHDTSRFDTTRWSLIDELASDDRPRREAALAELARQYDQPIRSYLMALGTRRDMVDDIAQDFFAKRLLTGQIFQRADRDRARLRVFIKAALRNFRIDVLRSPTSRPSSGGTDAARVPSDAADPAADDFERAWAVAIFTEAMRRLRESLEHGGDEQTWKVFEMRTVRPIIANAIPPSQETVAETLQLPATRMVAEAVYRVRRRMPVVLRQVIGETVADARDIEDEYRAVMAILKQS